MEKTWLVILLKWWLIDLDALGLDDSAYLIELISDSHQLRNSTYSLLEFGQVGLAQSIGLCNDREQVDSGAESLHDLNIQRLQCVSGWADEVETGVDTEIDLLGTAWLLLLEHIRLVLVVKEFDNWLPGIAVVDIVAKAGGVNNGQSNFRLLA